MERDLLIRLVTKAQNGNNDAMNQLFANFYNDVYYFALKTVKDSDTACDITQETFLEIINTIGNLKEPAAFVTWMKQITYHQCTRYFKKKKDVLVEEDEDGNTIFDTLADESEGSIPAEVYEKEEFRNTILGIINELTEEQRSAVMMYYFDELTVGQIAQIQGVSEGTVKSRLNYARKAIKKSVENYEKKYNIKLHSFSFLPLLLLFFGKESMPVAKAAEIQAVVAKTATTVGTCAAAVAEGAGTAAAGASVEATAVATGTGLGAKLASLPIVTKIIAGVVAAGIVTCGGLALAGNQGAHTCRDVEPNLECDICGVSVHHGEDGQGHWDPTDADVIYRCVDSDMDCTCDICHTAMHYGDDSLGHGYFCALCGTSCGFEDADADHICDVCGELPCGEFHHFPHYDENSDGKCDWCAREDNLHRDEQGDGYCDHCGDAMCRLNLKDHEIPDGSCVCAFCGEGSHREGENHPFCGICRERLPLDDRDGDGACDTCGEYSCGGSYHGNNAHVDEDSDGLCDICRKYMCGLVWGLEHNVNYDDGIYDEKCDNCGLNAFGGYGWYDDELPHADENSDGRCDCCDRWTCSVYGMSDFGGVDADGDGKCDICGLFLCDGHGAFTYHYDFDKDGKCDRCDHYICAHGYLPHTDENKDNKCDNCHSIV